MRKFSILLALLATVGCAMKPGVGQRDVNGDPVLQRLTPDQWANIGPHAPVRMSVADIVALSEQRVPANQIINRYYQTGTRLKLDGAQLADLARQGVPQPVLDFVASAEQNAARTDAITAQADQAAQARTSYERALYATWWGGPYWGNYYWGAGVFPYAGYAWGRGGSGWYGGVGVGF